MKPGDEKVIFNNSKGDLVLVILPKPDDYILRVDDRKDGKLTGTYAHFNTLEVALRSLGVEVTSDD